MAPRLFVARGNINRQAKTAGTLLGHCLLAVVFLVNGGCSAGGGSESGPPAGQSQSAPAVANISLTPQNASISAGQTSPFTATATDANGNVVSNVTFTWTSSNQGIATISTGGLATGLAQGSTTITATSGTVTSNPATLTVTVAPPIVASITLTPTASTIQVGQQQQFTATAKDGGGNTIPGVPFTWSSSNSTVASISGSGLATGLVQGSTAITATSGPVTSNPAALTVTPSPVTTITITPTAPSIEAGRTQQFTATARDGNSQVVPNVTFTWSSSNQNVATIATSGLVTGVSAGTTTIRATIGAVTSNPATLTVTPSPITTITITPTAPSIPVGQTQQFVATARDGNNQVVPNVTFTWTSSLTGVASITTNGGLVTGVAPGATTIRAAIGVVNSNLATLTVTTPTVNSITVTPTTASILVDQAQQFTAIARDVNNNVMPNVTFTWGSSNPGVASVDTTGFATAGPSVGTTTITAASAGITSPGAQLAVTNGGSVGRVYSTNFNYAENPLSDGGNWINGKTTGLDWSDVKVTPGFAHANQITASISDPTAVLTGVWAPNQTAQATIVVNTIPEGIDEIELRLNTTITAGSITGYELDFQTSGAISIIRWEGAIGRYNFILPATSLPGGALKTGDVLKATNVNGLITCYVNGAQVAQVTDTTYTGGSPGIGFYYSGSGAGPTDHGISAFSATD